MHAIFLNLSQFVHLPRSPGAHRIAHWLRQHNWDIEVVDWANHWPRPQLEEFLRSRINQKTKFIGIGQLFHVWDDHMEDLLAWIKSHYPNIVVISGSASYPTYVSASIDYYIHGFAEYAVLDLLQWLFSNGSRPRFDLSKVNGKHVIKANDTYAAFPMKSLSIIYERRDFIEPDEWLGIEFARGCKFSCDFCNFPVLGVKGDYTRDADDFEHQIRDAHDRFGVTNYTIADETFNDRTEKITKFADVVDKLNFQPYFVAFIRADLLVSRQRDREELARMNVLGHFYGIESFNTASARSMGKGMPGPKLQKGLIECRDYFDTHRPGLYRGEISLILGLPYETLQTLEQSRQWLLNNWRDQAFLVFPLDIYKGNTSKPSELTRNYAKYGYQPCEEGDLPPIVAQSISSDVMFWRNEHMNYMQANQIAENWIKMKHDQKFRINAFNLGHRFHGKLTTEQRLNLTALQSISLRETDVNSYIRHKLDC